MISYYIHITDMSYHYIYFTYITGDKNPKKEKRMGDPPIPQPDIHY